MTITTSTIMSRKSIDNYFNIIFNTCIYYVVIKL